ncbi:PREDICTED: protein FAM69A-like [Priapulus caudatus]|uniref:Protein FAM69A-like n=1 Tax=Priapulus caudatus TaxID=37621 RepID=A0ABM1E2W2_PRICU|nr:PREDICTED: protein FAM69A-like [Priapulus caudatus]
MKAKYVPVALAIAVIVIWLAWNVLQFALYDPCHKTEVIDDICKNYKRGEITGTFCYELCESETVDIGQCDIHSNHHVEFLYQSYFEVDRTRYVYHMEKWSFSIIKSYVILPSVITYREFELYLKEFAEDVLGPGEHSALVDRLLAMADINHDAKISLAEAQTIWLLIHTGDFFLRVVLRGSSVVATIQGFCGGLYAYEDVPIRSLYSMWVIMSRLWPSRYYNKMFPYRLPSWQARAKHVVALLEFADQLTSDDRYGSFYVCNVGRSKFGFTLKDELRITDMSQVISKHALERQVSGMPCETDSECSFGDTCVVTCDSNTHTCRADVALPPLSQICRLVKPYIMLSCPTDIAHQVELLLYRCSVMRNENASPILELEANIVRQELFALLWDKLQYL